MIGLGILLAGVPDGLAVVGWLGWTIVALSLALALWLGAWPFVLRPIQVIRRAVERRPAPQTESDARPAGG